MAQMVLSDISADAGLQPGTLFQGLKFWLSQKVPQRSRFINDVRANGGDILPLEKNADIKIVDHARKEALPGTHSYTFIEGSVRNGVLEDLQHHQAGPPEGTVRSVGSIIQPAKETRNRFTQEDDRILWNWVHINPQKRGGTDGNEIYKQLEAKHPQHPWQAWRDHWIKQLKGRPRPFPLPHNAPPTPPSDLPFANDPSRTTKGPENHQAKSSASGHNPTPFEEEDAEALMRNGADILEIRPENMIEAFEAWARDIDEQSIHTAQEWQAFWEDHVRRRFLKRIAKQTAENGTETQEQSTFQFSTPSKRLKVASQSPSSKTLDSNVGPISKSPSYHPESPSLQLIDRSPYRRRPSNAGMTPRDVRLAENIVSAIDENMRRNRSTLEEELPSSSPPEMMRSPKRLRRNGSEPIREIASTPDKLPVRSGNRPDSPLFIDSEDDDEEDEYDLEDEIAVNESPMGKQPSETLSEPGYVPQATQGILMDTTPKIDFDVLPPDEDWDDKDAFLREPTQAIDFEVLPPDQGWDDEDSGAEASSESESTATEISDRRPARQGTQAILRGQTAAPDFEVPEPEGGWEHVIPSSPPPIPSSPPAESEVSDVDAQTEAWINTHAVDGISIDQVLSALKCTSMDTDLAEVVLTSVRNYGRIPRHKRGIWTDVDDEDLSSPDARNIQRLESKHGKECLTARWEFLSFYRNV